MAWTLRRGIDPVIAVVILVVVAVAIAVAVGAWLLGVYSGFGRVEVYLATSVTVGAGDYRVIPLKDYARIEIWVEDAGGGLYTLYFRVTAVKNLEYLKVKAEVRTTQGLPKYAGNPVAYWEESDVPQGWYSERFWTPITGDELPVTVVIDAWLAEG